ncbi:MAG: hypothetical protein FH756_01585 [Firmicutes bacterium]|nr:hypothetical protein [Bacillota bacterium]
MSIFQEAAKRILSDDLTKMQESIGQRDESLEFLQERLAELELALEDTGWMRLSAEGDREFSREGLRKINQISRLYWLKNPLIKRAVLTQTQYVFGQGVNIEAEHSLVNEVVQEFLDDHKNRAELTEHQSRMIKETELQLFANIFFVFFVNRSTGRVRIRTIPMDEITDVITDPDDAKTPLYYRRDWTERKFDTSTGQYVTRPRTAFYPDWKHPQPDKYIAGQKVEEAVIYHVAVNKLSDMKFGVSEIYAACDWARAYKEFLENWATIVKAYSRFAWQLVTKGGKKGVASAKEKLQSTFGTGTGAETNPPPISASTFIGTDGAKLEPIKTQGATTKAEDGRRLLLMVSAATGIYEHYFGDPSTGNLATAKSMERPMELMFRDRQQLWSSILCEILQFVIEQSVRAPRGKLPGQILRNEYGEEYVELAKDTENEDPELRVKSNIHRQAGNCFFTGSFHSLAGCFSDRLFNYCQGSKEHLIEYRVHIVRRNRLF